MFFLSQNYFKKPLASILVFCLIGLSTGLIWFYPKESQAQCPVMVATDVTGEKNIGLETGWEGIRQAFQKGNLTGVITSAGKLAWQVATENASSFMGVLLNELLHTLLAQLSNDIVNWINNGANGKPRFLSEGLDKYLLDAAKIAGVNFLDQYLGAGWLCEPFDASIKIALLETGKFETKAKCTFEDIGHNLREFYDDFTKGGWEGWIKISEPQNNFYGSYLMALDEKNRVATKAQEDADKEAAMGKGFLSVKKCTWYDSHLNKVAGPTETIGTPSLPPVCNPSMPAESSGTALPCQVRCQTETPGSVVSEIANKAITSKFDKLTAQISGAVAKTGPFAVYVTPVINALLNKIITGGLSLIVGGDEVPARGDLGAAINLPEILSSEKVIQNKDNTKLLSTNLNSLKTNVQDSLLQAQKGNAAVIESIRKTYNETIPILNEIVANCAGLSGRISFTSADTYQSYLTWAQEKLTETNSAIQALDQRINEMALNVSNTNLLITNIGDAENLALNYDIQSQNWLDIYERVQGDEENQELKNSELSLKTAETDLIRKIQEVVQGINNTVASSDLEGLSQEIQDSIIAVITDANNLNTERGDASWPEAGTLYGELDEASALKSTAATRNTQCLNAHSSSSSSLP